MGRVDKKEYTLIYSGPNNRTGQLGTGFIIDKKIRKSLLDYEAVSYRICKIRLKGRFRNVTLVSVHTPAEERNGEEKEEFYDILGRTCEIAPKYDIFILVGDFNARIGKEDFMKGIAGRYSLHEETNENGSMLGRFA
jgi:exonuclease III